MTALLIGPAIRVRGVEKRHAGIQRGMEHGDRGGLVAIGLGREPHASQSKGPVVGHRPIFFVCRSGGNQRPSQRIMRRQNVQRAPMKQPFQLVTPDRLQIREGGGCLSVFGLPFFAAGVFMTLTAIGLVPMRNADGLARPVMALLAIVFTGVGGALVFGRSWTTLDRARREIVKQRGLLIPMHERIVPLHGFTAVTLGFVQGDSDSADRFPIALKAQSGPDLSLCSLTEYAEARACARAVGGHLHLDLEDASTDHPVRLPAGQPDQTLQERLRVGGIPSGDMARPADTRSHVTREHGVTTIVVPARPLPILLLAGLAVPAGIALLVGPSLWEFFRRTQTPDVRTRRSATCMR